MPVTAAVLESIFYHAVGQQENTRLIGGADEPLYLPYKACEASAAETQSTEPSPELSQSSNHIYYRADYVASALHEVAHWCVAGAERRTQEDYGYWYAPDGRNEAQQQEFERVEVKPQALELLFSEACGLKFSVSADNLAAGNAASDAFKNAIYQQADAYRQHGMPNRARIFRDALYKHYGTSQ